MYRILLATRSPLYAPIYHAWATSKPAVKNRLQIDYSHEMSHKDDLVCQTLTNYNDQRPPVLLAVGDVTRLCSYIRKPNGFSRPKILGGFIDRICFWLVDQDDFEASKTNPIEDRAILCHPRHMTSYQIASYYMRNEESWDDETIGKRLLPIVPPGLERQYYSVWKNTTFSRIAYMSSEIPRSHHGIEVDFSKLDKFKDTSMTGFFSSELLCDSEEGLISEFLQSVKESIRRLYTEGDQVPWELYDDRSLPVETGLAQDYDELTGLGSALSSMDAYSTNLALPDDQLERSLRIRSQLDSSLMDHLETLKEFKSGVPEVEDRVDPPIKELRDVMEVRRILRSIIYSPARITLPAPFDFKRGLFVRLFYLVIAVSAYFSYTGGIALVSRARVAVDPEFLWGSLMAVSVGLALLVDRRFRMTHAAVPPFWTVITVLTVLAGGFLFFEMVPDFLGGREEWLPGPIIGALVAFYLGRSPARRRRFGNRISEIFRKWIAIPVALGRRIAAGPL